MLIPIIALAFLTGIPELLILAFIVLLVLLLRHRERMQELKNEAHLDLEHPKSPRLYEQGYQDQDIIEEMEQQ